MKISLYLLIILLAVCFSCAKEETNQSFRISGKELLLDDVEHSFQDFSVILSKAVYNEPSLRCFLKNEALKQVDNDYDVFYPWVRDNTVDGNRTFRDILAQYDDKGLLDAIEAEIPLLTIYVPDWSWLNPNCFSVLNWDTSQKEVAVSFRTGNSEKPIYGDGRYLGSIPRGNFPDHPVLIVKNNERISVKGENTKASERKYSFVDPEYDGTDNIATKGQFILDSTLFSVSEPTSKMGRPSIPPKIIAAYNYSASNASMPQRDHIYYDMTDTDDTGSINYDYTERIIKFKLNPSCPAWYDDTTTEGADTELNYHDSPGQEYTANQQKAMEWDEGNLEIAFYVRAANDAVTKYTNVRIGDAFTPTKVYYRYYKNLFNTITWRSYYTYKEYLVPKWIPAGHDLFNWNLKVLPYIIRITVEEKDSGALVTRTVSESKQFATNFTTTDEKNGYGTGSTSTITNSFSWTETYTQSNDDLGGFYVQYSDKILTSSTNAGAYFYPHVYSTGYVDVILMPRPI